MNIIFTVCNRTSLCHALALAKSVQQFQGSIFYLCWVDTTTPASLPDYIKLITIEELKLPQWQQMCSQYYDFELLPATRPWFAKHLLGLHPENHSLIFLAPTVWVYQSLDSLVAKNADIQVTPHITAGLPKSNILDDKRILNIGMFHAGSWILKRSEESLSFLNWWAIRTLDRAKFDLCNGMCMDQLWLNFVLVHVKNTLQITEPGWHYGLHTVLAKDISLHNGKYLIQDKPLITANFAGLDFFDPIWSDHAPLLGKRDTFKNMYSQYRKEVSSFQKYTISGTPGYGQIPAIKSNRLFRKKLAGHLTSITRFIDQF